ncbi:hypothetical protein BLOT_015666 [Blomia tropicalis]|nr:hypothetical protein BLOT_015666 [Blomia tropicalis]
MNMIVDSHYANFKNSDKTNEKIVRIVKNKLERIANMLSINPAVQPLTSFAAMNLTISIKSLYQQQNVQQFNRYFYKAFFISYKMLKMSDQDNETNIDQHIVNYSQEQIYAAIKFENEMKDFANSVKSCTNCTRKFLGLSIDINGHCDSCQEDPMKFTERNNMKISSIPNQLKNLSYIELMLIARFHPIVLIYNENEHKIAFQIKPDEEKIYDELQLLPSELSEFIILTNNLPPGFISSFNGDFFNVRIEKLDKALEWLEENNDYYRDIECRDKVLKFVPSTKAYWETRYEELRSLTQISLPTIFLTLTAAYNYWPDKFTGSMPEY